MSTYANGDTGSDRAYDYEREARDAAIDAKNEWIIENGPFDSEDAADEAYAEAQAEWQAEMYRDDERAAFYAEAEMARWDDDPSPYAGDYSEM